MGSTGTRTPGTTLKLSMNPKGPTPGCRSCETAPSSKASPPRLSLEGLSVQGESQDSRRICDPDLLVIYLIFLDFLWIYRVIYHGARDGEFFMSWGASRLICTYTMITCFVVNRPKSMIYKHVYGGLMFGQRNRIFQGTDDVSRSGRCSEL